MDRMLFTPNNEDSPTAFALPRARRYPIKANASIGDPARPRAGDTTETDFFLDSCRHEPRLSLGCPDRRYRSRVECQHVAIHAIGVYDPAVGHVGFELHSLALFH